MQCKHCKRETAKRTGFCDKECTREFRAMEAKYRYDQERAARRAARQEKPPVNPANTTVKLTIMEPRYTPQTLSRGLTEKGDLVHLYRPQVRPGLSEVTDYPLAVACLSGAWHIKYSSVPDKVTCPACRETALFKSKTNSEK